MTPLQIAYNALCTAQSELAQTQAPDGLRNAYVIAKADVAQARRAVAGLLDREKDERGKA